MKVTDVTIKKASNGYILDWYDSDSNTTIHATFEEAAAQLQAIFEEA
jgi:hypothetical protein